LYGITPPAPASAIALAGPVAMIAPLTTPIELLIASEYVEDLLRHASFPDSLPTPTLVPCLLVFISCTHSSINAKICGLSTIMQFFDERIWDIQIATEFVLTDVLPFGV